MSKSGSLNVKREGAIVLPIYGFLVMFNSKMLTLVFRCVHGQAPINLSNLANLKVTAGRPGLRSGKRKLHLKIPFTKCQTFVDRSFSVYGPKMWNNLPDDIRAAVDIGTCKRKLKTWMFTRF